MKLLSKTFGTLAGLLLTSAAFAAAPDSVTIPPQVNGQANPSYGGTGCPAGSARAVVAPDRSAFTMIFDKYIVETSATRSIDRKNCQILVNFDFPQGWSYSLVRLDYRGFFDLGPSSSGYQQSLYYFQGLTQQARLQTNFVGPKTGNYTISDTIGLNMTVWSPCGARRGLNINSSLYARAMPGVANSHAYLTNDSLDGSVKTTYAFQWKKCPMFDSSIEGDLPDADGSSDVDSDDTVNLEG